MKIARLLSLVIVAGFACLALVLLIDYVVRSRRVTAELEQCWRTLSEASSSLTETERDRIFEQMRDHGWWYTDTELPAPPQIGIIKLGNGQNIVFAFMSHHGLSSEESLTVFDTGDKQIRTVGGFCCEVQFSDEEPPKDLDAFVELLGRHCRVVEITEAGSVR